MNELTKITEAKYFYDRMLAEFDNREVFTFKLSAFLSAARSVLQYALEEAKTKPGGQQWYDRHIAQSSVLSFFKDKRDINIHIEPIKPVQHTKITAKATIYMSASVHIVHRDKNGNVLYESPPEVTKPRPKKPEPPTIVTTEYRFADWTGSEDLITLSKMYLDELQRVVEDGRNESTITG